MKKTSKMDPHGKLRKLTVAKLKELVKGCDIVHDRPHPKKADLVELIEMCLQANGRGYVIPHQDYSKAIDAKGHKVIGSEEVKKGGKATRTTLAKGHGWTSRYDSWYIMYSYTVGCYEYAFLWETYYDEIHRGYSNVKVWYDELYQTTYFTIRYDPKRPEDHYTTAPKFVRLVNPTFVGKEILPSKEKAP